MKRDYTSGVKTDVEFFVGYEIEHTPAHGLKTLFVVGVQPVDKILLNYYAEECEHIYIGANQSFDLPYTDNRIDVMDNWNTMIKKLLITDILVTLDFDLDYIEYVQSMNFCEFNNFIPQISVKIPNIKKLNYNATVKIDDVDFKATNPGVWCHRLNELMRDHAYTDWKDYVGDHPINKDEL